MVFQAFHPHPAGALRRTVAAFIKSWFRWVWRFLGEKDGDLEDL